MAELLASQEKYLEASAMLSSLPAFGARAKGFQEIDAMKADSSDWKLRFLDLNTPYYREFSPLILNNMFLWSTNEPVRGSIRDVAGWDGNNYTHINSLPSLDDVKDGTMPSQESYDTSGLMSKRMARRYAMADNNLLRTIRIPKELILKREAQSQQAKPIIGEKRLKFNIAHPSYNPATNKVYISVNNQQKIGKNEIRLVGIAEANIDSTILTDVKFLPLGGSDHMVMHPAIHPNGKLLVYASNQPGGKGGYDLYFVNRVDDTTWTEPTVLTELNSAGNELFAGFTPNGELFYASDGLPGFGGLDIYSAKIDEKGTVSSMYHLPTPVNSAHDEFSLVFTKDGNRGFFTSDRFGEDDILAFDYELKKLKVSGYVVSRYTEMRKPGVKVIFQKKNGDQPLEEIAKTVTDSKGDFTIDARPNYEYVLTIDNGGDDVQHIDVSTKNTFGNKPLGVFYVDKKKDVYIKPDTFTYIIYFDFDKSKLKNESKVVLDQVIEKLKGDLSYKASFDGHTDLLGGEQYNIELSASRESTARSYVESAGIEGSRLKGMYYGKKRPVIQTKNIKKGYKNRRVEILIAK
jgi:outer membrane protein OmpA-like peptidoglycan-associated protein